ncbi:hypothetical protein GQX73_g996 [Xylaria multiplex]|uniref:Small acidic protein n=1 Tax=Xylaria multiplex TaxID=323545 RepID=A0A7C8MVX0_9PEZI|nr:hypothetical protein GQX73_g996 [Xylaria multiplex]
MDEQKKLAKEEKRRKRLRLEAEQLEAQARELWAEAQKARARADVLDEQKEDEDERTNKLKQELGHTAQDSKSKELDAPLDTDGRPAKKAKKNDTKLRDKVLDQIMEQELGPSITADGLHLEVEAERKRKRKEEKRAEKRKRKAEAEASLTDAMDVDAEDETEAPKEKKKKKRKVEHPSDDEAEATPVKKDKKKKKKDKKDKKKRAAEENEVAELVDAPEAKKDKKKKSKKEEQSAGEHTSAPTTKSETTDNSGGQWNVAALEGDSKRKQKFLRLLGGGKANGEANSGQATSTSSKADIAKMQSDLERQFDVGMRMKQEGHNHRRGLGA